jgi:hypothetical protein
MLRSDRLQKKHLIAVRAWALCHRATESFARLPGLASSLAAKTGSVPLGLAHCLAHPGASRVLQIKLQDRSKCIKKIEIGSHARLSAETVCPLALEGIACSLRCFLASMSRVLDRGACPRSPRDRARNCWDRRLRPPRDHGPAQLLGIHATRGSASPAPRSDWSLDPRQSLWSSALPQPSFCFSVLCRRIP